jgi:hypothetical protein
MRIRQLVWSFFNHWKLRVFCGCYMLFCVHPFFVGICQQINTPTSIPNKYPNYFQSTHQGCLYFLYYPLYRLSCTLNPLSLGNVKYTFQYLSVVVVRFEQSYIIFTFILSFVKFLIQYEDFLNYKWFFHCTYLDVCRGVKPC